ncbi:S9 family peptidase [Sphingomonas populi]|uniref:S9 family peptidase n=1 Tax=Sphingomonas populi TaxID=2484750 RepID=A0A4V2DCB0_9SPHN|nr:prolyl oligopeptidase family serine peptidase [Sphingomonas populi]RZF60858.1 S9 family peptidase [Sphingomonas populi]
MTRSLLRAALRLALPCLLAIATPLGARPYSVDDMLMTEAFGRIETSPRGRWLVFERLVPFETAARFDLDAMDVLRSRLYVVDLARPAEARPLLPSDRGAGMVMLGFSPDGTRLAIGRLDGSRWTLGVVTLASRAVRWFAVAPDTSEFRPTLAWVSGRHLVMLAQADATPPWVLRRDAADRAEVGRLWALAQAGRVATVTAIGSGRDTDVTPPAPPVRLVRLDVTTGATTLLAQGNFETLRLSPDRRHVALTEQAEVIRVTTTAPIRQSDDLRRRRLRIVDVTNGHAWSPCAACDLPFDPPAWSPHGDRLLFFARRDAQAWAGGQPWVAKVGSRQATPLALSGVHPEVIMRRGAYDAVGLGWLGARPLLFGRKGAQAARTDWYALGASGATILTANVTAPTATLAAGATPIMLGSDAAWRLGAREARPLLSGMDGVAAFATGAERPEQSATLLGWRHSSGGIVIDGPSGGTRRFVARADSAVRPVAASAQNDLVLVNETEANGVAHLAIVPASGSPLSVATINARLASVSVRAPVPVRHHVPGGAAVTSWLYLPEPGAARAKPPLIVIPYAGTVYGDTSPALWNPGVGRTYTNVPALVGHGYAVLLPSMPALAATDHAPFDVAGQVLAAVDAVIARGEADPARLGLWGHSYGGYTGATIATETDRFKAMIVSSGIYDLTSFQGTFAPTARRSPGYGLGILPWAGWTETGQPGLGATPWSNPARYVANSPVYHADRITTPLLIMADDRDFTPLQQGEQLFSALYRQGKDAQLVSYWGENHVLMNPANVRDAYARAFAWFDRHFAGAGTPQP